MRKSILELAGVASWAELRARGAKPRKPRADELTASAADRRAKGTWFRGYTEHVRLETDARVDGDLEIDRTYVLYEMGLQVSGTLRLGDTRSIVVVLGDLRVGRLELGDDVLVVTGRVIAKDYVLARPHEGIFEVRGQQAPARQLGHLRAPWYIAFDPHAHAMRIYRTVGRRLVEVPVADLAAPVRPRGKLDLARVRAHLAKGRSLI